MEPVKVPGSLVACTVLGARDGRFRIVVSTEPAQHSVMSGRMLCVIARPRGPRVAEDMLIEPDPVVRVLL
jgi:hypothetical protein